jgi:hypothetical protein
MARLALIETAGNQRFVFSTNKLVQNAGASELIHRIGTTFVLTEVAKEVSAYGDLAAELEDAQRIKEVVDGRKRFVGRPLSTAEYVRRLERIAADNEYAPEKHIPVEVLAATSGKAVLLVDGEARGKDIIQRVTLRALRDAPGAAVRGVVSDGELDLANAGHHQVHELMTAVHRELDGLRLRLTPPEGRFPTLPITAPCLTSGLPAEHRDKNGEYLSASAHAKREEAQAGWLRVRAALKERGDDLARNVERLDDMNLAWLAVVHADGNGFGKVFLNLANRMPERAGTRARDYCTFYRKLSLSLDMAGVEALYRAMDELPRKPVRIGRNIEELRPIVPLVFGGDDLTVICDGTRAVSFAASYLQAFERTTAADAIDGFASVISQIVPEQGKPQGFGGGAGIAIVKHHYPFHRAYELAEQLTGSAKTSKRILDSDAASALDFHIVYEDTGGELERLRQEWIVDTNVSVHARPYVVSAAPRFEGRANAEWARRHHIDRLKDAMRAIVAVDDEGRPILPRSQQHALRAALFEGKDTADTRLGLIRGRYDLPWNVFGEADDSLFFQDPTDPNARTRFLDALELVDVGEARDVSASAQQKIPEAAE